MKYSKQRNLILNIVKGTETHPTAQWVFEQASKEMPGIGIATVYRNLHALAESGDVVRITGAGTEDRFDGKTFEHCHLICSGCGNLVDLELPGPDAIAENRKLLCETFGLKDPNIGIGSVMLRGVCNECMEKAEKVC